MKQALEIKNRESKDENMVFKGDNEVMSIVEKEIKNRKEPQETSTELTLIRSIRKNIQEKVTSLENCARIFNFIDWSLFVFSMACMGLTTMGISYVIYDNFTLQQLFGALALTSNSVEHSLGLSKTARSKKKTSREMKTLLRTVSMLELKFYTAEKDHKKEIMKSILDKVGSIWETMDNIQLDNFLQPDRNYDSSDSHSYGNDHHSHSDTHSHSHSNSYSHSKIGEDNSHHYNGSHSESESD